MAKARRKPISRQEHPISPLPSTSAQTQSIPNLTSTHATGSESNFTELGISNQTPSAIELHQSDFPLTVLELNINRLHVTDIDENIPHLDVLRKEEELVKGSMNRLHATDIDGNSPHLDVLRKEDELVKGSMTEHNKEGAEKHASINVDTLTAQEKDSYSKIVRKKKEGTPLDRGYF